MQGRLAGAEEGNLRQGAVFATSPTRLLLLVVAPALAGISGLVLWARWGLNRFRWPDEAIELMFFVGLPLAAALTLVGLSMFLLRQHAGCTYRVTPTRLILCQGSRRQVLLLAEAFLTRSENRLAAWAQVSDGKTTLRLEKLFLPGYERLCQGITHLSRRERELSYDELPATSGPAPEPSAR